jgi:hypothetical protein
VTDHIRVLAIFQMAQGGLEFVWGLVFAVSPADGPFAVHLFLAGLAASLVGLARLAAGLLNMFLRGRVLGMATVVAGLASSITCCCLPTSLALCCYGLIVYSNADVRRAFA